LILRQETPTVNRRAILHRSIPARYGFFRQTPTVGLVPHLAPSAAPPLGQNTDTSVSLDSQLTEPSAWTARILTAAGSPLSPFGPGAPCGPCGPCAPAWPCAPATPWTPCAPWGPAGPCGPGSPFGPGSLPQPASASAMLTASTG